MNLKKNHKCIIHLYDLIGKPLPLNTDIYCFWCKHSFNSIPIGCPLSYDNTNDIYITDGLFCSFNCTLAYINDNSHNYN